MNNELSTAFIDSPPEGFAVWNLKTQVMIRHILSNAGVPETGMNSLGAYKLASQGNYYATKEEITEAYLDTPEDVLEAVNDYTSRVEERSMEAAFNTEDEPGKS